MRTVLFSIYVLLSSSLFAQEQDSTKQFSINTQLRPRAEYRNGALYPRDKDDSPAAFIGNRARMTMNYERSNLAVRFAAQHVGVWGQDTQTGKEGHLMLNEAWAKFKMRHGTFIQLGRQTLSYDDERILGAANWSIPGRFHDLLKLGYQQNEHTLELSFAFSQNTDHITGNFYIPSGQPYKSLQSLWYHFETSNSPFTLSLLALNVGWQQGTEEKQINHYMQTVGTYATYSKDQWHLNGSLYYQRGKNKADQKVSAYMAGVSAAYDITPKWSVNIVSDYLSGDDQNSNTFGAFEPLYGTHHKFYGSMDYFYASSYLNGLNPGLWDNGIGINFKPSKTFDHTFKYHYFSTAGEVKVGNKWIERGLGSEFDYHITWQIMKDVKLMGGYSFMLGTKSMDILKGGNHNLWQDWGWISLEINPQVFFSK